LAALETQHVKPFGTDTIRDRLEALVGSNVGEPFTANELSAIHAEAEDRYKRHVPPGYSDEKKSKQPDFMHRGATYRPKFGDLILWKQIIRYSHEKKIQRLMLISDDEKQDWRQIVHYKGDRLLIPRPELVDEIRREGGVEVFQIYSSELFLKYAKELLGAALSDNTIPQVTNVKEAAREDVGDDENLSLLQIVGEEGNRRDGVLYCGHCRATNIDLHFYEGAGTPKLDEVLGLFHYWRCPAVKAGTPVRILLLRPTGEAPIITWTVPRRASD
jgi:hypothetical protein